MTKCKPARAGFCIAAAVSAVAVVATGRSIGAACSSQYPTAAFTFDDSSAYDLQSDGRGAYAHSAKGKDGYGGTIDAEFTLSGTQANANLNLVKSVRRFLGAYTYDSPGNSCANPCPSLGNGTFTDGWFLTIYGVPGMFNGETKLVQAFYKRGGASTNPKYAYPRFTSYWCSSDGGTNACGSNLQNSGSMMVLVSRQDVGGVATWTATTGPNPAYPLASDLSEIVEQTSSTSAASRGLYRSSFRVVIRCLNGCSALPYPPN